MDLIFISKRWSLSIHCHHVNNLILLIIICSFYSLSILWRSFIFDILFILSNNDNRWVKVIICRTVKRIHHLIKVSLCKGNFIRYESLSFSFLLVAWGRRKYSCVYFPVAIYFLDSKCKWFYVEYAQIALRSSFLLLNTLPLHH